MDEIEQVEVTMAPSLYLAYLLLVFLLNISYGSSLNSKKLLNRVVSRRQVSHWYGHIHSQSIVSSTTLCSSNNEANEAVDMNWDPHEAPKLDFNENYYDILEVSPQATAEELKKGYYKVVFKYHPDNRETETEKALGNRQMMVINYAYKILKDPKLREEYDEDWALRRATIEKSKPKASPTSSQTATNGIPADKAPFSTATKKRFPLTPEEEAAILQRKTASPVSAKFKRMIESSPQYAGAWREGIRRKEEQEPDEYSRKYDQRELHPDDLDEEVSELLYSLGDGSAQSLQVR